MYCSFDRVNSQGACHAFRINRPAIAHDELALIDAAFLPPERAAPLEIL